MWPFGGKNYDPLAYTTAQPFIDPTFLMAPSNNRVPLNSFLGGTGLLVRDTVDAFNPANYIPINSQVVDSVYGSGYYPTVLTVQQMLTDRPNSGSSI